MAQKTIHSHQRRSNLCSPPRGLHVFFFFFCQAKSLGEQEWRSQQLGVVGGGHHFESDTEMSDMDDDDRETLFSSMDLLSPSGHSDAQTLAMMLQEQLDAINKEIRWVGPPPLWWLAAWYLASLRKAVLLWMLKPCTPPPAG